VGPLAERSLLATADHLGQRALFKIDAATGAATPIIETGASQAPQTTPDGRVVYLHDTLRAPAEIWIAGQDGRGPKAITHLNDARVAAVTWGEPEQFKFAGKVNALQVESIRKDVVQARAGRFRIVVEMASNKLLAAEFDDEALRDKVFVQLDRFLTGKDKLPQYETIDGRL